MIPLILALLVVGVVLYFLPLDPGIKQIIVAVVALCALVAVLSLIGILPGLRTVR